MLRPFARLLASAALLAVACSPAPPAAPAVRATASAAPARPDPFRVVVLDNQVPSPLPGLVWARLQPDGRTVTLLPAGEGGARAITGGALFLGPPGRFAAVGEDGAMEVYQDAKRVMSLGAYMQAAFSPGGEVLAWDSSRWAVFSRDGDMLRGGPSAVALSRSGLLIERSAGGITRLLRLPTDLRLTTKLDCRLFYPRAGKMLCIERTVEEKGRVVPYLHVISLDTGEDAQRARSPGDKAFFGFNATGTKLAAVLGDIQVYDVAADRWASLATGKAPYVPYKVPPRVAFTADEKHVCVEEDGAVRIAPPLSLDGQTAATCFFVPRPPETWVEVGLAAEKEWEALIVSFPITAGFRPIPRGKGPVNDVETEVLSRDGRTAVVIERSITNDEPRPVIVKYQALVIDTVTHAVRRTVPVTSYSESYRRGEDIEAALSGDGRLLSVCARGTIEGAPPCKSFDTTTGAAVPYQAIGTPIEKPPGVTPPIFGALGASAALDAISQKRGSLRVLSWKDEGPYLSIDIGTEAGPELHLNLPDTLERVAAEVEALPDGSMLAIATGGVVDLWQVQPIGLRATLTRAGRGAWAALYPDGTFEWIGSGDAAAAVACERGGALFPLSACASRQRPAGTLRNIMASASR